MHPSVRRPGAVQSGRKALKKLLLFRAQCEIGFVLRVPFGAQPRVRVLALQPRDLVLEAKLLAL